MYVCLVVVARNHDHRLRPLLQTFQNSVQQLHTERAPHMPKVAQKYYTRLHVKSYEFIFIYVCMCILISYLRKVGKYT